MPAVQWGALKAGDRVSTLSSIVSNGPTLQRAMQLAAANDNGADQTADLKDQLTAEDLKRLGVRVAANDNGALGAVSPKTLKVINTRQLSRAVRVYNLEIESRPGEITHNYLVGDQLVWVHNATNGWPDPDDVSRNITKWRKYFGVGPLDPDVPNTSCRPKGTKKAGRQQNPGDRKSTNPHHDSLTSGSPRRRN